MQRQCGELIPIGDALSELDGPVKALCGAAPQARRHFTQADQVNHLVSASEADADLGFMARMMALCSLPRTNPGDRIRYKRVNGPYTLYMTAGGCCKLPFGNFPRLLLAWVSTEAVRTQSRELVLGRSLSELTGSHSGHPNPRQFKAQHPSDGTVGEDRHRSRHHLPLTMGGNRHCLQRFELVLARCGPILRA